MRWEAFAGPVESERYQRQSEDGAACWRARLALRRVRWFGLLIPGRFGRKSSSLWVCQIPFASFMAFRQYSGPRL